MNQALNIADTEIQAGTSLTLELGIPSLYTNESLTIPVQVRRGRRSGACLVLCAAIHGDEINGVEIIRRVTAMKALRRLRGTLITVPVVNVYGFIAQSRYLPDRRDLNRSFPGRATGSLTSRLADTFHREIVSKATHLIDLHTAAIHRDNFPQIRAMLVDQETRRLAEAFGAPVMLDAGLREGSIRQVAHELGIHVLVYEGGEALRFDEFAIRAGVRGILSVMRALEMLPPSRSRHKAPKPVLARGNTWLRASASGIVRSALPLGAQVGEGETLAIISDPFGGAETPAIAPVAGILIGKSNLPLAIEGEALFNIARVPRPGQVEERVGAYAEALAEADELADITLADDEGGREPVESNSP
jgi:hypothetical protein